MAGNLTKRTIRIYHGLVANLLLLGGVAGLAVSILLRVSYNGVFAPSDILSIINDSFLILAGIASLIGFAQNCVGMTFRGLFVFMRLVILVVLVGTTVVCSIIVHKKDDISVRDALRSTWVRAVSSSPDVVCREEKKLGCRGYEDNDCIECISPSDEGCDKAMTCARCSNTTDPSSGCYSKIIREVNRISLPIAIVAAALVPVQIIDLFVTCAS